MNDWLENPFSNFSNITYRIVLFLISENAFIKALNTNSPGQLIDNINEGEKIIIAESGVTGLNIRELKLKVTPAPNELNRFSLIKEGVLELFEPMNAGFYDKLLTAARLLEINNIQKMPLFLEISFIGEDEFGNIISNPGLFPNERKKWLYNILIKDIRSNIGPEGSTHTITFMEFDNLAFLDNFFVLTSPFTIQATRVKDIINGIVELKRKEELEKYGYERNIYKFKFVTLDKIPEYREFSKYGIITDPTLWEIRKLDPTSQSMHISMNSNNKIEINFPRGQSIGSILEQIFAATEEGSTLLRRTFLTRNYGDTNEMVFFWWLTPRVKIRSDYPYDYEYNTYNYEITYEVIPYISFRGVGTMKQFMPIIQKKSEELKNKVLIRRKTRRLIKKYEYIFTGLNTEIIDLNIEFDNLWKAIIPMYNGRNFIKFNTAENKENTEYFNVLERIRENTIKLKQTSAKLANINKILNTKPVTERQVEERINVIIPERERLEATRRDLINRINQDRGFLNPALINNQKNLKTDPLTKRYLEDLDSMTVNRWNMHSLISIDSSVNFTNQTGKGNIEPYDPINQSMAWAILNQLTEKSLIKITMTIKGDPYWLGITPFDIVGDNPTGPTTGELFIMPDFRTGEYSFLLTFGSPIQYEEEKISQNFFNGVYVVTEITHNFIDGIFTQVLECKRDINVDINEVILDEEEERKEKEKQIREEVRDPTLFLA